MLPVTKRKRCFVLLLLALGHFCQVDLPGWLSPQVSPLRPRDISPAAVWPVSSGELREAALQRQQPDAVRSVPGSVLRRRVEQQRGVPVLQHRVQGAAARQAGVLQHAEPRLRVRPGQVPGARVLLEAHGVSARLWGCPGRWVPLLHRHRRNRSSAARPRLVAVTRLGKRLVQMKLQDSKL